MFGFLTISKNADWFCTL